jgi:undecaprenyl-diphosphatase
MYQISETWFWLPLYLMLIFLLYKQYGNKSLIIMLLSIIVLATCDQVASHLIKENIQRLRPSHQPGLENYLHYVNGYRGGDFGFVSSHAANSFGLTAFLFFIFKFKQKWMSFFMIFVACIISYSRIYLGVHYPSDVIVGGIIGIIIGLSIHLVFIRYISKKIKFEIGN